MKHTDNLIQDIERGLKGLNIGVTTGLEKFDELVAGIQKKTIYNIGAGQGVGKTSLALYSFIYKPLQKYLDDPNFKLIYFSLEINAEALLAKLLSIYLYETFNREISYKKLLSRTKYSRLTEEEFELILKSKDWLCKVEKALFIYDKALTADGFYAAMKGFAEDRGEFISSDSHEETYKAHNSKLFVLAILDHVSLIRSKGNQTKKDAIDIVCSEAIYFRNKCEYSFVLLQQLNRTSTSMDRRKAEMQEIELQDFKDTAGPSEAADVVVALFFPHRDKMSVYRKYKIAKGFREAFRSILILKNRYGPCDQIVPINFFGSIGLFKELEEPEFYESVIDYGPYTFLFPPEPSVMEESTSAFKDDFLF